MMNIGPGVYLGNLLSKTPAREIVAHFPTFFWEIIDFYILFNDKTEIEYVDLKKLPVQICMYR